MPPNAPPEAPTQAANTLISHLRHHPEDASGDARHLADSLELPHEFVEQVLQALQSQQAAPLQPKISLQFMQHWLVSMVAVFDRWIVHPRRFLFISMIACLAIGTALQLTGEVFFDRGQALVGSLFVGANALVVLTAGVFQMACYFRKGMMRFVLYGTLVLWGTLAAAMLIELFRSPSSLSEKLTSLVFVAIGSGMLSLIYAALGGAVSVLGGWVQLRRIERREEHLTRQELLERYFEIQNRIRSGEMGAAKEPFWMQWAPVEAFEESPIFWSFFAGVVLSLTTVLLSAAGSVQGQANVPVVFALTLLSLAKFLLFVCIGFFSRTVLRAIAVSFVFSLSGLLPLLLPIGRFGIEYFRADNVWVQILLTAFSMSLVSVIAVMGAQVQQRHWREASLQKNDQAALAAEMLRIQWRLFGAAQTVCVMVVDAARSSEMKSDADPLSVEYSFREYQEWIETISESCGGQVHNTAGDGAVVSFNSCADAYQAARRLQTDVARFNRDVNRLRHPFRLRIGLHSGEVAGTLEEVEFTEVIDVAAHIQSVAPISGIAVSETVVAELSDEEFVQMAKEVDAFRVHLALNPVDD